MKKLKVEDVDRISELPESILHHILSFLSFKQVVQTCVLSKRWEKVWHTYPDFEFDETLFGQDRFDPYPKVKEKCKQIGIRRKQLFNCLEKTLRNRQSGRQIISINKFTLGMQSFEKPDYAPLVYKCVSHAILINVKELKLRFGDSVRGCYSLPQSVLCAKSTVVLDLSGYNLRLPRSDVDLSSLRKLLLSSVYVNDYLIKNLISGCPLIEDLSLSSCCGFRSLELFGLEGLKEVKIIDNQDLERVEIKASSVQSLAIVGQVVLRKINIDCCKNLRSLRLDSTSITDEWLCNLVSKLSLLKYLQLSYCHDLKNVQIASSSLKTLSISTCFNLVELKINTPGLRFFDYSGDMISFFSNALDLSNVNLTLEVESLDTQWHAKHIQLLSQFHHFSEILNLTVNRDEDVILPEELKQLFPSPLFSGKDLGLTISMLMPSSIAKVVDSLIWILPHIKKVSIKQGYVRTFKQFHFTYKKELMYEEESASCCKCMPIPCWQHCIRDVKLEIINDNHEGASNMKIYSLEDEGIYEKIADLRGRF